MAQLNQTQLNQNTFFMTTHFITAEVALQESAEAMHQAIESELQKQGDPLRWALVAVDAEQQIAQVEAVVTTSQPVVTLG
jgi:hypothetical protein